MKADVMSAVAALAAGYAVGGVPFGYILARARGIDIRKVGSGNVGATNVGRALGRKWGLLALALDIAKGFVPVFFLARALPGWFGASSVSSADYALSAMGLGAILGHVFTPWLGFRGGKGVATSIGVFAALLHFWIALPLVVYLLVRKLTGYVSAGSLSLAALLPAAAVAHRWDRLAEAWPTLAFACFAALLIVLRHRANIVRLVKGEELAASSNSGGRPAGDETA
ncbi:MAG: glycerol-3-phosphate 1-O-acyltransferase PlsY [Planctomycetota bacterium]